MPKSIEPSHQESESKVELLVNPDWMGKQPVLNKEALNIIKSNPLWMRDDDICERFNRFTKTEKIEQQVIDIHPCFNRSEVGFSYKPKLGFKSIKNWINQCADIENITLQKKKELFLTGPFGHGEQSFATVVAGAYSLLSSYEAYKNPDASEILFNINLPANKGFRFLQELVYREFIDNDNDFVSRCLKMIDKIIDNYSRFSYILANNSNLDIIQFEQEMGDRQNLIKDKERIMEIMLILGKDFDFAEQENPRDDTILLARELFSLIEKCTLGVDAFLTGKCPQ
jgi:hypothetical protein